MNNQKPPTKAVVSVSEMAQLCELSRSRFYALIGAGVFPGPVQNESCKRPHYDQKLQQTCLEIRRTGIGFHGQPVMFNKKSVASRRRKLLPPEHYKPDDERHKILEAVRSLGLSVSAEEVAAAIDNVFPYGTSGFNREAVIRGIFFHLRGQK